MSMTNVSKNQTIKRDNKFWTILDVISQSQGRGGATLKVRMEDLSTGKILSDVSFRPNENVEVVDPTYRTLSILFSTRDSVNLIDPDSGDEFELPLANFLGGDKAIPFYDEATPITVLLMDDTIIRASGPEFITAEVANVDDTKGNQSSEHRQTTRNATLKTGAQVVVPSHIKVGDKIKVDVVQRRFIGRV